MLVVSRMAVRAAFHGCIVDQGNALRERATTLSTSCASVILLELLSNGLRMSVLGHWKDP